MFARSLISVVMPWLSTLNLAVYSVYKFWDPSRLCHSALLYRHVDLRIQNEFGKVELCKLSLENTPKSPKHGLRYLYRFSKKQHIPRK